MNRSFLILCLLFTCVSAMAQATRGWYQVFTGKIAKMEVTLHLHAAGDQLNGYIWFSTEPVIMQCYSEYDAGKKSLVISATTNPLTVILTGKLGEGHFSGEATIQKENNEATQSSFTLLAAKAGHLTTFDYFFAGGTATMPPNLKNDSKADYLNATIWPDTLVQNPLKTTLKTIISKALNKKETINHPGSLLMANRKNYIDQWKKETAKLSIAQANEMGLSYSTKFQKRIEVMYEDERVITIANFEVSYTGGAHENYATFITNIDKKTGNVLKLKHLLTDEGVKALPGLLEQVTRQQYGLDQTKTLEQNGLFVNTIHPSENFYITNGNLGFYYPTYELLPFAYGEPNLFIPASVIEKYLKPGFKKFPDSKSP